MTRTGPVDTTRNPEQLGGLAAWMGDQPASVMAAILVCVAGSLMFPMVPVLVDTLSIEQRLSTRQIGLIASADTSGMFVGAGGAIWLVCRLPKRLLASISLALLIFANTLSIFEPSFLVFLALRLTAGACGGLMMAIGLAAVGKTRQPDRNYALSLVLQTLAGSGLIRANSHWSNGHGLTSLFILVSAVAALLSLPIPWLRESSTLQDTSPLALGINATNSPGLSPAVCALTAGTFFIWGVALLMVWAYVQTIGRASGLGTEVLGNALSVALFGGAVGSLVAVVTGSRFGRVVPTLIFAAVFMGAEFVLSQPLSTLTFALATFLWQATANAGVYPFGALAGLDPAGRLAVVYLLSLKAGFGIGPTLGSFFATGHSYGRLLSIGACLAGVAFSLFIVLIWRSQAAARTGAGAEAR